MKVVGANLLGHVGYWSAAAVIVVAGWSLYHASRLAESSTHSVDHTLQALALAAGVNESLGRAEAANRGFVLYGQRDYLPDRDAGLAQAAGKVEELRLLTQDSPAQQQRLRELEELLRERAALMRDTESASRGHSGSQAARDWVDRGRALSSRAYAIVDAVRADELLLLAERRAEQMRSDRTVKLVVAASIVFLLAVLIPAYMGFVRVSGARTRAERNLRVLAESLPAAVFQYRSRPRGAGRFEFVTASAREVRGVDAQEALRNPQALVESIVESDRGHFLAALAAGGRDLTAIEVDCRVAWPDGGVRWIRTTAAPRRGDGGDIIWSGSWTDVTDTMMLARESTSILAGEAMPRNS